mgnify:CR=1 FL=1
MSLQQFAETHEVTNQVPSLDGANLYRLDLPLQEWIRRYDGAWADERLSAYGALAGGALMQAGFLANENKPVFKSHDRYGNRIDLVEFHPAYHELMRTAVEHGLPIALLLTALAAFAWWSLVRPLLSPAPPSANDATVTVEPTVSVTCRCRASRP